MGSLPREAASVATAASRTLVVTSLGRQRAWPCQRDSPCPFPGLPAAPHICFRESRRMGALTGATAPQRVLPTPPFMASMTSSNWALQLAGGKCPSFKSKWLFIKQLFPIQPWVHKVGWRRPAPGLRVCKSGEVSQD